MSILIPGTQQNERQFLLRIDRTSGAWARLGARPGGARRPHARAASARVYAATWIRRKNEANSPRRA